MTTSLHDESPGGDVNAALAGGGVHVVCFADESAEGTATLLRDNAGLDETERRLFCDRINAEDMTGSLWPIARLSALPARFARAPLTDLEELRTCLHRVYELNATLCKCPVLILDLRGASDTAAVIAEEARRIQTERGTSSLVRELVVV